MMDFSNGPKRMFAVFALFTSTSAFTANHPTSFALRTANVFNQPVLGLQSVKRTSPKLFMSSIDQKEKTDNTISEAFDPLSLSSIDASQTVDNTLAIDNEDDEAANIGIWTARLLLLIVAMLWGTNFASVKYLENLCFHPPCSHPPSEAALARFGVAALVSLPLLLNQRKDVILAGLECGIWITLGYFTQALALSTVPAAKCAFICSLTVVIVPLISAIFYGEKMKPSNFVSAGLALAGVGILEGLVDFKEILGITPALADADVVEAVTTSLITPVAAVAADAASTTIDAGGWLASTMASIEPWKGDLLALGQPFGFGLAFMRIEHYVEKFKDVKNRVLTISAAQCVAVGFLSLLWVLYDFHGTIPNMAYMIEPHRIGAIAWTGIMTTVVAIYFEGIALQVASATEAALTFASEPVWAALFGAWLLHEELGINSYIGGVAILSACVYGALADMKAENEEKESDRKSVV